jgi:hypothetical protein
MFRIIRAVLISFMASFWWWAGLAAIMVGYSVAAHAEHPEALKIRAALDANFDAYNKEDVKSMMATLSPTLPDRNRFESECAALFRDNDSYISVRDFELLGVEGQYASARVIQGTTTTEGAPEPTQDAAFYRENSKLLPTEAETEYVQAFKKEGGKWRLWLVLTQPKAPVKGDTDDGVYHGRNAAAINKQNGVNVGGNCANGNCSFPRVKVTTR